MNPIYTDLSVFWLNERRIGENIYVFIILILNTYYLIGFCLPTNNQLPTK